MADAVAAKAAVTQTSFSIFGYDFNFYGLFLLTVIAFFVYLFWKAQKNNRLDWVDIITRDGRFVSLTKILNLLGGFVGTWVVVQITIAGDMTWDILAVYLAYVASIEGFSKFVSAKYSQENSGRYHDRYYTDYTRSDKGGGGKPRPPQREPGRDGAGDEASDEAGRLQGGGAKADID